MFPVHFFLPTGSRLPSLNIASVCRDDPNKTNQGLFLSFATAADKSFIIGNFIFRIGHIRAFPKPCGPQVGKSRKQEIDLFFSFPSLMILYSIMAPSTVSGMNW